MRALSKCTIDHSLRDVKDKLESQRLFLPDLLYKKCTVFLSEERSQLQLNDLFHLLKKYDLASTDEQEKRNEQIIHLTNSQSSGLS